MNREELLKYMEVALDRMKKELKDGYIKGCLILIRQERATEIEVY